MVYRSSIALAHIFLAFFVSVQIYAFYIDTFEENMPVIMALFVIVSTAVFYLAFKKADPQHYAFKHVFVLTLGYWTVSSIVLFAKLMFLNVFLVAGFFYYLMKSNPAEALAA